MSFDAGNPFDQMGSARPAEPSMLPKIIAVIAALFAVLVFGVIAAVFLGRGLKTGLAQGLYAHTKDDATRVADTVLWGAYMEDDEEADKLYKDRWVIVTGKCSEVDSFRPDGSAINEQYVLNVGSRARKLSEEWRISCNIPRSNVAPFNRQVKSGGTVAVLGRVKGRNRSTDQVEMEECELVSFSPE